MTTRLHRPISTRIALTLSAVSLSASAGCATAPAVGPLPGSSVGADVPAASASAPPDALTIQINIDHKTVSPSGMKAEFRPGRTVVLSTRSDHDTSLTVTGPGIHETEFIGRLTQISTTFVADLPGVIVIKSTDPAATIASLAVG